MCYKEISACFNCDECGHFFEIAHEQRILKYINQMMESLGQGPKGECLP